MLKKALVTTAATLALAACGGGASESADDAATTPAAENTATAAPAANATGTAASTAPAPDNVETIAGHQFANFTGDPAAGEKVFAQCRTCHVTDPGVNRIGPSLAGIVGREAGTVAGYNYTPANANSGITWTQEKLFQYLENPQRVVPGTKMAFAGIQDPQRRADLIAWLATQ